MSGVIPQAPAADTADASRLRAAVNCDLRTYAAIMDDDARQARRSAAAREYEQVSEQRELAARHLRAAEHMRNGDIPSACAHVVAARGDALSAERTLDDLAIEHAARASV